MFKADRIEKKDAGVSWARFFVQALKDLRFYLYCAVCLSAFRFILIMTFGGRKNPESGWADILTVMANGFRFDSRVSFCVIIPTLLLDIAGGFFPLNRFIDKTRYGIALTFTALTLLLCGATIPFFKEYDDQFNQWVLGLIFDDVHAIIKTIWTQAPVGAILLAILALMIGAVFILKRILNDTSNIAKTSQNWPLAQKIILTICLVGLLIAAGRGSVGPRPVQLKDAAVTRDDFLNKTVLNPYAALHYVLKDYRNFNSAKGLEIFLPDGDIRSAVKSYFNDSRDFNEIDQYLQRTVQSANEHPPKHIFLIVMEGYDSWPMLDQYQSMQMCPQLKSIAEKGIWIRRFLPASVGTTPALAAIMTGLPDANATTNYQPSSRKPYPSAIAPIFRALGYKTRFFYGGYLSWQHIGDFARNQGFEEIYGAPHMGKWAHANEWGVDDEALFEFIEKTISDDQPSFSMVMTTTYHPPYDIDVFGLGFPTKSIPSDLAGIYDGSIELKIFGHLWYADNALGEFVQHMEQRLEKPLFAVTGDHWSRKFLNSQPSLYEKSSVPFVLYGPGVLSGKRAPDDVVGCHTDIGPTVIELCAPIGFVYHGIGRNLLTNAPSPAAFGARNAIIGPDFIMNMNNPKKLEALPGYPLNAPNTEKMIRMANQYYAIGWWRIMRGSSFSH
jgi:phosphoglycerol transferase MdoB-like AlkP superfamily enzyme